MDEIYIKNIFLNKLKNLTSNRIYHQMSTSSQKSFSQLIEEKINHFSWGLVFLHLKALDDHLITDYEIDEAYNFECFGLSVELLDDFLDQDNPLLKEVSRDDFIMLYTEILISGIYPFAQKDAFGLGLTSLMKSLNGEWEDLKSLLITPFSEEDYFESVIHKSTEFFSYLTYCAIGDHSKFHAYETLMKAFAEMTQILNDIRGIYDPNKNDLIKKSPTLPLIKFIECHPDKHLNLLKCHSKGFLSTSDLIEEIEKSGSIRYCQYLLMEYKSFIINHIETHFSMEKLHPLLSYFKLESWYEPFKDPH